MRKISLKQIPMIALEVALALLIVGIILATCMPAIVGADTQPSLIRP